MRPHRALLVMVLALALGGAARSALSDRLPRALAVVVARGSKVARLTRFELRRAFSGEAVVVDDLRLVPFNYPPGSPERLAFDRTVLDKSEAEVGRYWVDRKIRGDGQPPHALPTAAHVTKIVGRFAGAIGYVPVDQLTEDVVPVEIDGLLPGSPGYPIAIR